MERNIAFSTALEHVVDWRSLLRVIWYTIWQIHFSYRSTGGVGSSRRRWWWQKRCQYFTVIGFSFLFYSVVMMMVMNDGLGWNTVWGSHGHWDVLYPSSWEWINLGAKTKLINQNANRLITSGFVHLTSSSGSAQECRPCLAFITGGVSDWSGKTCVVPGIL